jgi:hypothetical protein
MDLNHEPRDGRWHWDPPLPCPTLYLDSKLMLIQTKSEAKAKQNKLVDETNVVILIKIMSVRRNKGCRIKGCVASYPRSKRMHTNNNTGIKLAHYTLYLV